MEESWCLAESSESLQGYGEECYLGEGVFEVDEGHGECAFYQRDTVYIGGDVAHEDVIGACRLFLQFALSQLPHRVCDLQVGSRLAHLALLRAESEAVGTGGLAWKALVLF